MRECQFMLLLLLGILFSTSDASAQAANTKEVKADTIKVISPKKAAPLKSAGGFGDDDQNNPSTGEGSGGFGDSDQDNPSTEGSSSGGYSDSDMGGGVPLANGEYISFADDVVKDICVANWDANGDGELSEDEAAVVTDLGTVFKENTEITSFDELQYFTGLTTIGNSAFNNCSNLASISMPEGIMSIGNFAFHGCGKLSSFILPNGLTNIGNNSFEECVSLPSITIPNSVISIGSNAFTSTHFNSIVVEEGNTVYDSRDNCNAIIEKESNRLISGCKNTTIPLSVTAIGREAFSGRGDMTSITIPCNVTSIEGAAFFSCSGLTSVTVDLINPIPISSYTFTHYTNATLYVPFGSKAAYEAANNWKNFKEIIEFISFKDAAVKALCVQNWDTNGDGELDMNEAAAVTNLGVVFSGNTEITSFDELRYFTGLKEIGSRSFYWCRNLSSIVIPENVETIGTDAFNWCSSLADVEIPESVTTISRQAFRACWSFNIINIPNSVTSIGDGAFYECKNVSVVSISANVKSIGESVFSYCPNIESIFIDENNGVYDSRNNCNAIIRTSTNELINGCKNSIIPSDVTSISNDAFYNCSGLTSVTIPESVTSIGSSAFYGCSGLTSIIVEVETPLSIYSSTFSNYSAILYVPYDSKAAYRAAAYWNNFREIVYIGGFPGDADGNGKLEMADALAVVNYILTNGKPADNFMFEAANIVDDGVISIADAVTIINAITTSSPDNMFAQISSLPFTADFEESTAPFDAGIVKAATEIGNVLCVHNTTATAAFAINGSDAYAIGENEEITVQFDGLHGWAGDNSTSTVQLINSEGVVLVGYTYSRTGTSVTDVVLGGQTAPGFASFFGQANFNNNKSANGFTHNQHYSTKENYTPKVTFKLHGLGAVTFNIVYQPAKKALQDITYSTNLEGVKMDLAKIVITDNCSNEDRAIGIDNLTITSAEKYLYKYTINYVDENGTVVKVEQGAAEEGAKIAITTDPVWANGVKYYVQGNDSEENPVDNTNETVITVQVKQAATYSYTVTATDGTEVLGVLAKSSYYEGETVSYPYPRYFNVDGTLYKKDPTDQVYNGSFLLDEDNKAIEAVYAATETGNVICYVEAEDVDGLNVCNTGTVANCCSMRAGAWSSTDAKLVKLAPGTYTLIAAAYGLQGWRDGGAEY